MTKNKKLSLLIKYLPDKFNKYKKHLDLSRAAAFDIKKQISNKDVNPTPGTHYDSLLTLYEDEMRNEELINAILVIEKHI